MFDKDGVQLHIRFSISKIKWNFLSDTTEPRERKGIFKAFVNKSVKLKDIYTNVSLSKSTHLFFLIWMVVCYTKNTESVTAVLQFMVGPSVTKLTNRNLSMSCVVNIHLCVLHLHQCLPWDHFPDVILRWTLCRRWRTVLTASVPSVRVI